MNDHKAAKEYATTGFNRWENEELNLRACYLDLEAQLEAARTDAVRVNNAFLIQREELEAECKARERDYNETAYLTTLLWEKHYKVDAPQWEVLLDTSGVLAQIDNMTSGLVRVERAEAAEAKLRAYQDQLEAETGK